MARTRSTRAHQKVLEAALALFSERGIEATSMDAIAETSGVSKATIYKHWADKEALCLETLTTFLLDAKSPEFDSGDVRADLIAVLAHKPAKEKLDLSGKILPHVIAYSATHPKFGWRWRSMILQPVRSNLSRLVREGMRQGTLMPSLNVDVAVALLLGPMMYRRIMEQNASLPEQLPAFVVDNFWRANAVVGDVKEKKRRARRYNEASGKTAHVPELPGLHHDE